MSRRHKPPQQHVELNLTPMLDVILLLIIFFLLVTNFTARELPPLEPPTPDRSQAHDPIKRERVIINIMPDEARSGRADRVRIGLRDIPPDAYAELTDTLRRRLEQAGDRPLEIDLRADRSIHYAHVQPVMNAITAAGIGRINLVAFTERHGRSRPADATP